MFSDLDGTLLDHDTYDWRSAQPALRALKDRGYPVILASSKTLAEMRDYREQFDLHHPIVAENGAAVHIPPGYFPDAATFSQSIVGRAELQSAYKIAKLIHGYQCDAFFELGIPGIIRETGLTEQQAIKANDRAASEPILWLDTDERAAHFEQQMQSFGFRCIRGGRFMHLMGATGKADAVQQLLRAYSHKWPEKKLTSIALGDGPNDLGMLAAVDIGVIIPGKHSHRMDLSSKNRILKADVSGPMGWNNVILSLLAEQDSLSKSTNNGA